MERSQRGGESSAVFSGVMEQKQNKMKPSRYSSSKLTLLENDMFYTKNFRFCCVLFKDLLIKSGSINPVLFKLLSNKRF